MPALSQSLTFTVNNTSTVSLSYPNTATTALTYYTEKVRGDGYYGNSDGFHTVQFQISNFVGRLEIEGTLAISPTSNDWATVGLMSPYVAVDTTGLVSQVYTSAIPYTTATTLISTYNFSGNYVWIRSKVSNFTQGNVNSIKYNN
jgi:hypothetical protein